jgi:predicted Zn-ribbon and HTH transcriptional regulator
MQTAVEHVRRALNKIKKPSTAEEITELLNRELGPGDQPFQTEEIETWLRNASDKVLRLYWLETRPRR